jgi:tetratricopeptide (TPR) repeat protein
VGAICLAPWAAAKGIDKVTTRATNGPDVRIICLGISRGVSYTIPDAVWRRRLYTPGVSLFSFLAQAEPQATSLLGKPLFPPPLPAAERRRLEADHAAAFEKAKAEPSAENIIWLGRRTAYLGLFREAIQVFAGGMSLYPDDPRLYRHRGHRYITVRELERSIADLEKATELIFRKPDEVEPDGQPNARKIPLSTLHGNIWYHLALARYLKGNYTPAIEDWKRARAAGKNDDNLVSTSNWLYLSLRRAKRDKEAAEVLAPITPSLDVIENASYHSLLLLYKGVRKEAEVLAAAGEGTAGTAVRYGVSAWYLANGRPSEAVALWERILGGSDWPAFGHIGAEADMARMKKIGI